MSEVQRILTAVAIMNAGPPCRRRFRPRPPGSDEALEVHALDLDAAARLLRGLDWVAGVDQEGDCLVVHAPFDRPATSRLPSPRTVSSHWAATAQSLEPVYFKALGQEAA
jgi:hypothetical protein